MKKNTWLWVIFALLVVVAVAYPFLTKNSPLKFQPVYVTMDSNSDGQVSQDEFAADRAKFMASVDKNNDGKMTPDEFVLVFSSYDLNKNGVVTREEYLTFFVGQDELSTGDAANLSYFSRNYPGGFVAIDSNKDGSISVSEFKAYQISVLRDLDTNNDRQLTKDEFDASAAKRLKVYDKNGDGALNVEEYTVGAIKMPPPPPAKPAAPAQK